MAQQLTPKDEGGAELRRYKLFGYDDLTEEERDWYGACDEYRNHVFEVDENGKRLRHVGSDDCEPEDRTLMRDLSWVLEELNCVYEAARAAGRKEGAEAMRYKILRALQREEENLLLGNYEHLADLIRELDL